MRLFNLLRVCPQKQFCFQLQLGQVLKIWVPFIIGIIGLTGCSQSPKNPPPTAAASLDLFVLKDSPTWGQTVAGDSITIGGFSGLYFVGQDSQGEIEFLVNTDRGPNGEPVDVPGVSKKARPFLLPEFQPRWVRLKTNQADRTLKVVQEILLTDPKGRPLTGRPQWSPNAKEGGDEKGASVKGKALTGDLLGIDPEGLVRDSNGFYWMGEEYRPSLLKFSPEGRLLKRYIPQSSLPKKMLQDANRQLGPQVLVEALPQEYRFRRTNRGFEGITFAQGRIYAIFQSAIEVPGAKNKNVVRLVEFDPTLEKVTGEYLYPFFQDGVDKIGDLAYDPAKSRFLLIEQNSKTGPSGIHKITAFELGKPYQGPAPETISLEELKSQGALLNPQLITELTERGYDFAEKVEGLMVLPDGRLAVINDNDFGVNGDFDPQTGKVPLTSERLSKLGILGIR